MTNTNSSTLEGVEMLQIASGSIEIKKVTIANRVFIYYRCIDQQDLKL